MTQKKSSPASLIDKKNLPARPGDVWESNLKNTLGRGSKLMMTDEESDEHPGYFKCYYLIGSANIGPWTFLDSKTMRGFTLYQRKESK
jgi:hypothetical protein